MNGLTRYGMLGHRRYYAGRLSLLMGQWRMRRILITVIILGLLLITVNRLLSHAQLAHNLGTVFLSEILLILIVSPYLSCRALADQFSEVTSDKLLVLSRIRLEVTLAATAVSSQVLLICFAILTASTFALVNKSSGDVSFAKLLSYHVVLLASVFSSALIGMLGWRIFSARDLRRSVCIRRVTPNDRWGFSSFTAESLHGNVTGFDRFSIIPVFLLINPLIAVCQLLEIDLFRTPHLYELTPLPSYLFVYPKWYAVSGFQVLVGLCCLFTVSRLGVAKDFHHEKA